MAITLDQLRQTVTTAQAAKILNRAPQTMRTWASRGDGPVKPIRINGRLAWPLDEISRLLNGEEVNHG